MLGLGIRVCMSFSFEVRGLEFEIFLCFGGAGNLICLLLTRNYVSEIPSSLPHLALGSRGRCRCQDDGIVYPLSRLQINCMWPSHALLIFYDNKI